MIFYLYYIASTTYCCIIFRIIIFFIFLFNSIFYLDIINFGIYKTFFNFYLCINTIIIIININ